MSFKIIIPPTAEPVTLQEAKEHLRVVEPDEDALIGRLIAAARGMLEQRINRKMMTQTIEFAAAHCAGGFMVPAAPFVSIGSVSYTDADGAPQTLPAEAIYVDSFSEPAAVVPAYNTAWPTRQAGSPLIVRAVVGYADAASVPAELKAWMLLAITALYDNRSAVVAGVSVTELPEDFMHGLWQSYMVYL